MKKVILALSMSFIVLGSLTAAGYNEGDKEKNSKKEKYNSEKSKEEKKQERKKDYYYSDDYYDIEAENEEF